MNYQNIRITGPNAGKYELGQPMLVFDGHTLIATLDPVPLLNMGTEIHVEAFTATEAMRGESRHVGRLIFLEICAFIAQHFEQIQAISFVFSRRVAFTEGDVEQATDRAMTMEKIGAINVRVTPNSEARPGHFVVSGIWIYSERNLAALKILLDAQRAAMRNAPPATPQQDTASLAATLRRLVTRRNDK